MEDVLLSGYLLTQQQLLAFECAGIKKAPGARQSVRSCDPKTTKTVSILSRFIGLCKGELFNA